MLTEPLRDILTSALSMGWDGREWYGRRREAGSSDVFLEGEVRFREDTRPLFEVI